MDEKRKRIAFSALLAVAGLGVVAYAMSRTPEQLELIVFRVRWPVVSLVGGYLAFQSIFVQRFVWDAFFPGRTILLATVSFVAFTVFAATGDAEWSKFLLFGAFVSNFFECVRGVVHSRASD